MMQGVNMTHFDVVVCGLGATGSAALYQLARRGVRVLGLERFAPGHDRGSSHGETRIIRLGYFEHPSYVPLVLSAYAKWREIEAASRRELPHGTRIAGVGPPGGWPGGRNAASLRRPGLATPKHAPPT